MLRQYGTQANIDTMEAIQRRAARFVLRRYRNTSSVSNRIDELRWPSLQDRLRIAHLTMLYKIRHELVCTNNLTKKLQPAVARQEEATPTNMCNQDAAHNTNNSRFYLEQSKIGITYPRALWRPQPSTLLCQGLQTGYIGVFFRNANLLFKSDRIINLLIAVALTEEEEEECLRQNVHAILIWSVCVRFTICGEIFTYVCVSIVWKTSYSVDGVYWVCFCCRHSPV